MKATDEMLWEALEIAQLKLVVKSLPGGLGEKSVFVQMCVSTLSPLQTVYFKRHTESKVCSPGSEH